MGKSEVTSLKERIDDMNKNIDMLTTMVKNVSMSQKVKTEESTSEINQNNKRTKTSLPTPSCVPDGVSSSITVPDVAPSMPSSIGFGDANTAVTPSNPLKANITTHTDIFKRETSETSNLSYQGFVDTLFTAFKSDEEDNDDI